MKEYRVIRQHRKNIVGKAFVFLLAGFPIIYQLSSCLLLPYLGFVIIGVAVVLADSYEQRIGVSQNGIKYHGVGFDIRVDWKNIQNLDTDLLLGEEGLYVRKSNVVATNQYFNLKPYRGFREHFFIPLSRFAKNWRNSELGEQIKQYVPHLFE